MNAYNENRVSTFRTLISLFDGNVTIWQEFVALAAAVLELKTRVATITSLEASRQGGTKGVTQAKQVARETMAQAALTVAGAVGAYASKINDRPLFAKVKVTPSQLLNGRDTEAGVICQAIYTEANKVVAQLAADYEVTAETLADFQTKIVVYNGLTGQPRTKQSSNNAAVALSDAEVELTSKLLDEQVNGMMKRYKTTHPSFYESYQNARRVVDNASGRPSNEEQPQPQPS